MIDSIISDGTLNGTQVLSELGLPALQMVKRIEVDINAVTPMVGAEFRIEHYSVDEAGNFHLRDGQPVVHVTYLKIQSMHIQVEHD